MPYAPEQLPPLTDSECDEFRRLPVSFNDMIRATHQAGAAAILRAQASGSARRSADDMTTQTEAEWIEEAMWLAGTWNRDREACRELAARALKGET